MQQRAAKGRLSGSDFSGDGDESLTLLDAVEQMSERLPMGFREKQEAGIGGELKGLLVQPVKLGIHAQITTGRRV